MFLASIASNPRSYHNNAPQSMEELFLAFAKTADTADIHSPIERWYLLVTICQWYMDQGILAEEFEKSFSRISKGMMDVLKVQPSPLESATQITHQVQSFLEQLNRQFSSVSHGNNQTASVTTSQEALLIDTFVQPKNSRFDLPTDDPIKPPPYECLMEKLPGYTCSVNYEGFLHKKMEFNEHGDLADNRSWRKSYFILWGTSLRRYKYKPTQFYQPSPFESFSMQRTKVSLAVDYRKRNHVFRLRTDVGQFLMQAKSRSDLLKWMNSIQMSANIALPLESMRMPIFSSSDQL